MNVYDFDQTIYDGDSSFDFYFFCLRKNPSLALRWGQQGLAFLDYKLKRISKTEMKTRLYAYFQDIPSIELMVHEFWATYYKKIKPWYLEQKRDDDLIISASPYFLLQPICDHLNVNLIASEVDPATGRNLGKNCYGEEKVRRMAEHYDIQAIENFYSDSYSDAPLAKLAQKSYHVVGDTLEVWGKDDHD